MDAVDLPILDQAFKSDPYPFYERLRQTRGPIVRVRLPTGVEAWLVTEHSVALRVLSDPRLSKRSPAPPAHPLFQHLLAMDPPQHTQLRAIAAREFTPQRVRHLRPRVTAIAEELVEFIAAGGTVDLIDVFALPFPLKVICELLGLPPSDQSRVQRWSMRLLDADLEHPERVPDIAGEVQDYLLALAREKGARPDDRLFSALAAASDRGELSEQGLASMVFLLLLAGHETTVSLIGNGVLALLRDRGSWARLCAEPSLAAVAVEELLRYDSPLEVATPRYAASEIAVEGVRMAAGDLVFVGLGAANRDERCFHDPHRLDLTRKDVSAHLAFGHGIHYCLGAALARLEGEVALSTLARRCPELQLAVPETDLRWKPGLIMRGLERLPVLANPESRIPNPVD